MRIAFLIFFLAALSFNAHSQETLTFTVQFPEPLISDAGVDTLILKGIAVRLGGEVPASGGTGDYTYQWSPTIGLSDPTIANPIATPENTTTYTLTVSDQYCFSQSTITLEVDLISGLEPLSEIVGMKFFPNPNRGSFRITTEQVLGEDEIMIQVFNTFGQEIFERPINGKEKLNEEIELRNAANGIYLILVSTNSRRVIYKIVIQ